MIKAWLIDLWRALFWRRDERLVAALKEFSAALDRHHEASEARLEIMTKQVTALDETMARRMGTMAKAFDEFSAKVHTHAENRKRCSKSSSSRR